jgi:hypothetical protein
LLAPAALAFTAAPALAQDEGAAIAVGDFTSEQSCQTYVLDWGRTVASGSSASAGYEAAGASSAVAGGSAAAASSASSGYMQESRYAWASEWGQELVRDCRLNFRAMRSSIEAALTASGKFTVARTDPGPRTLILTGRISEIGFASDAVSTAGLAREGTSVVVSAQYTVEDAHGDTVFGNLLTKTLRLDAATVTPGIATASVQSGRTVYTQLQRAVALAIARDVAFRQYPPRVMAVTPGRASLNYASTFLPAGTVVYLPAANGVSTIKCVVAPSAGGYASVVPDGAGSLAHVPVGALVTVVDADDPAAQGRRYERVDLPPG